MAVAAQNVRALARVYVPLPRKSFRIVQAVTPTALLLMKGQQGAGENLTTTEVCMDGDGACAFSWPGRMCKMRK